MSKIAISKDGGYYIAHGPHIFYNQMKYFYEMKDEMLDSINRHIPNIKLKLVMDEMYLINEDTFFGYFDKFESKDAKYAYIANFGNYALRFNICIDNILILLGHEYLIKSNLYDKFDSPEYDGHPLIMNYGPKSNADYPINSIGIDKNALYAYRLAKPSKSAIIVDDFVNESVFIKEIIKRTLSGYFYKDQNSCGCFQAIHRKPVGSIEATILIYLFNYLSTLDNFSHLVNYIYNLNMEEIIRNLPNSRARVNWANMHYINDELRKKGHYAELLSLKIAEYSKYLNSGSIKFARARNVVMHEGNILTILKKNGKKGIFICTDTNPNRIVRQDMSAFFDAMPFLVQSYAILLKLFSEFYGLLFGSVKNGETIFKLTTRN